MRKLLVLAVLLVAVGQAAAGAAPAPTASITACVVGGTTVVQWQHARVAHVALVWSGPGTYNTVSADVATKAPKGSLTAGTPASNGTTAQPATGVTATLTLAGGGSVQATGSCG